MVEQTLTPEIILQNVVELFEVNIEAVKSPSQYAEDTEPRHVYFDLCMLFQYELTEKIETCAWLVNRDVTTLRAGARKAQNLIKRDPFTSAKYYKLKQLLKTLSNDSTKTNRWPQ